jgi:hypothetical protein
MYYKRIIARDITRDVVDTTLEKDLTELKKDFESAKEKGSPQYIEKLLALFEKEQKKFLAEKPDIEKSIQDKSFDIVREDLLLRVLHNDLRNDGKRRDAHTIEIMGGKFTRGKAGDVYTFDGDDAILNKVKKYYSKEQIGQDEMKLNAMVKYFKEGKKALKTAIKVRDSATPPVDSKGKRTHPIGDGAGKLKPSKIMAYNQLPGLTCPGKGDCFNWCFALSGMTAMPDQMNAYAENLGESERDDFVERVNKQFKGARANSPLTFKGKKWKKVVRIHAYGDFHTPKYVNKWRQIAKDNPDVFFYAYTKSFYMQPMKEWMEEIHNGTVKNVKIIQSHGSKYDDKIDPKYPTAKVYDSVEAIHSEKGKGEEKPKHCDADDSVAADPKNKRVAIVSHGDTPCASGFCPYKKTTAATGKHMTDLPIMHLMDQIDLHHNLPASDEYNDLGLHLTSAEHGMDFGRHLNKNRFARKINGFKGDVQKKYLIANSDKVKNQN